MKYQENNLASILDNVLSSASTMDIKQDKLMNIFLQEISINISAKVEQTVEDRQKQWTTYGNLNLWFDTWEKNLVKLGFAYRDDEEKMLFLMRNL